MSQKFDNEKIKRLKQDIFDKVKEYYSLAHQQEEFIPGRSKVNYAGRVYDEKELINLVDSALEFWLTSGRYAKEFEKSFSEFLGVKYCILTNSGSSAGKYRVIGSLENTDKIMKNGFWLGIYPGMDSKKLNYMINMFENFFDEIQ